MLPKSCVVAATALMLVLGCGESAPTTRKVASPAAHDAAADAGSDADDDGLSDGSSADDEASADGWGSDANDSDANDSDGEGTDSTNDLDSSDGTDDAPVVALPEGTVHGDWTYVEVAGAVCRDGSPAGYYYRKGKSNNLHIFLNGGGACSDKFFCSLNPANVNEDLPHESLLLATGTLLIGPDPFPQRPPNEGVFKADPANPVGDWSAIFIPYCTGDVWAGTKRDVVVPGAENEGKNQFVGYTNMGLFLESFGPSFANAETVLLSGSSAGGFGALMNFDRVQTYFDDAKVLTVSDSGIPFRDGVDGVDYLAVCLQKRWRDLWGFDQWMPKTCSGCFRADGGGLVEGYGNWLFHEKYKDRFLGGFISTEYDGVIRAFFGAGGNPHDPNDDCKVDSGLNTIAEATVGGVYDGPTYKSGIKDAVENVAGRDRVAFYVLPGTPHMHLWRHRFYEENGLGMTMAAWLTDVLAEKKTKLGAL